MPHPEVRWKSKMSWRAKLQKPVRPKLVPISDGLAKRLGHGMMLIPTALEVDAMVRKIPCGQVSTLAQIRQRLARWHNVEVTCPLVTGIFLRIVAEAAEEDRLGGAADIAPYWRVVRDKGQLNTKFPGGVELQAQRLIDEGHRVENGRVVMSDDGRELRREARANNLNLLFPKRWVSPYTCETPDAKTFEKDLFHNCRFPAVGVERLPADDRLGDATAAGEIWPGDVAHARSRPSCCFPSRPCGPRRARARCKLANVRPTFGCRRWTISRRWSWLALRGKPVVLVFGSYT